MAKPWPVRLSTVGLVVDDQTPAPPIQADPGDETPPPPPPAPLPTRRNTPNYARPGLSRTHSQAASWPTSRSARPTMQRSYTQPHRQFQTQKLRGPRIDDIVNKWKTNGNTAFNKVRLRNPTMLTFRWSCRHPRSLFPLMSGIIMVCPPQHLWPLAHNSPMCRRLWM